MPAPSHRLASLLKLWDIDPSDPETAYMIAQEHTSAANHDEAVQWFDRALAIEPAFHYAYFHKARALQALANVSDALTVARLGLERATSDANAKASSELASLVEELRDELADSPPTPS